MKFLSDMSGIEKAIIVAIVVILGVVIASVPGQVREKEKFMDDCGRDHKQYECQAMWKQMHPDPIVVYAPMNR